MSSSWAGSLRAAQASAHPWISTEALPSAQSTLLPRERGLLRGVVSLLPSLVSQESLAVHMHASSLKHLTSCTLRFDLRPI
ncbi:unnamed protein product [Knipowitschia caucasica]|uniref:Uncharacterized protein n=1 Tax=Knipowitschia caucasica TaxID=637954 RepID=A0AAV2KLJ8_KNICA